MNIAIIGPSGVGKGTQVDRLVVKFDLVPISLGELFRKNVKEQSGLGLLAKRYVGRGELVPDEVVDAMFEAWLRLSPAGQGVVLDGFPRTLIQAEFLDALLKELNRPLTVVLRLRASMDAIVTRLASQRICRECQMPFSALSPFQTCPFDKCKGEHLYQPEDCDAEAVKVRLGVFERTVNPVLDHYRQQAKLVEIDGERDVDEVSAAIAAAIKAAGG